MALTNSKEPLVIRTYFSNESDWVKTSEKFIANYEMGFRAYLNLINDKIFEGFTELNFVQGEFGDYKHGFIFLADSITLEDEENPLLCIDLQDVIGRTFRVIPSELWSVENNLSINNMEFESFYSICDKDGVFRGFK